MKKSLTKKWLMSSFFALIIYFFFFSHAQLTSASEKTIDVWWPTPNAQLVGLQPFKALLRDSALSDYQIFWQVDGGAWNYMGDNQQDYPHKEYAVDLSGWKWKGQGPYQLNFIALDRFGNKVEKSFPIFIAGSVTPTPTPIATPTPTPSLAPCAPAAITPTPTPAPILACPAMVILTPTPSPSVSATPSPSPTQTPTPTPSSTPTPSPTPTPTPVAVIQTVNDSKLYVEDNAIAKNWSNNQQPEEKSLMEKMVNQPTAKWLGNWNSDVQRDVSAVMSAASAQGTTPTFVVYNIPHRDCGGYSAGGTGSADAYRNWIGAVARGIGNRSAIVVLEPDALAGIDCLSDSLKTERTNLLREAIGTLNQNGASVYLDAGNPRWIGASEMANRLKKAGVDQAKGFSLNVSNYFTTDDNLNYGQQVSSQVGGKHFVVDTSRNGNGPTGDAQWCNPWGRALGKVPTLNTGNSLVDAYLWIKNPTESDGYCNGGPSAGTFWPEYAIGLARNAGW
ncbi:MAG: glycoside hydrolase family 6 protein [bacterium]|nr:glycoside hydrolase family 6 protein [bacterium]